MMSLRRTKFDHSFISKLKIISEKYEKVIEINRSLKDQIEKVVGESDRLMVEVQTLRHELKHCRLIVAEKSNELMHI